MPTRRPPRYDRAYFDKWYRSPTHRVRSRAELARRLVEQNQGVSGISS
jgi:hypothetical protein